MKTGDLVKYDDLPLGARFHPDIETLNKEVWIKLKNGGEGVAVHWTGLIEPKKPRSICCIAGSEEERANTYVRVAEYFPTPLLESLQCIMKADVNESLFLSDKQRDLIMTAVEEFKSTLGEPIVLSRCPFTACGGTQKAVHFITNVELLNPQERAKSVATLQYAVICDHLIGGCGSSSGFLPTQEQAAHLWNDRS